MPREQSNVLWQMQQVIIFKIYILWIRSNGAKQRTINNQKLKFNLHTKATDYGMVSYDDIL